MIYSLDDNYYVRTLAEIDLHGPYPLWFADQDVCRYNSHAKFFKTATYFRAFYDTLNSDDKLVWAICHSQDGHIGNVSLQCLSFINRNAEFAIIIGDKRHWGKGVAFKAGIKMLAHGFFKINLKRIYCGTAEQNKGMKRLALKLGMKEEGRRRSHLYLEGNWTDLIEYGILKNEFELLPEVIK